MKTGKAVIGNITMLLTQPIRGLLACLLLIFVSYDLSHSNDIEKIQITTDKPCYSSGFAVKIEIKNLSEQETYIWTGPCSFILERQDGKSWEISPTPWSGCPLCGHAREIPHPLFLGPATIEEIEWDRNVTWCEEGTTKTGPALGRFRFAFRYTKDRPDCKSASDPLECWLNYRGKNWHSAYSNEFSIIEYSGFQP
jgi:hypothetical protein